MTQNSILKAATPLKILLDVFLVGFVCFFGSSSLAVPSVAEFKNEMNAIIMEEPTGTLSFFDEESQIDRKLSSGHTDGLWELAYNLATEYMKENRWQEAIWTLKRTGLIDHGVQVEKMLHEALSSNVNLTKKTNTSATNPSFGTVSLSSVRSIPIIAKPEDVDYPGSIDAEIWAYELDKIFDLNVVTMAVKRNLSGIDYSVHLIVPEAKSSRINFRDTTNKEEYLKYPEIYLLDFLTGEVDRHYDNTMFSLSKRLFAIDNARARYIGVPYERGVIHTGEYDTAITPNPLVLNAIQATSPAHLTERLRLLGMPASASNYVISNYKSTHAKLKEVKVHRIPLIRSLESPISQGHHLPLSCKAIFF